MSAKSDLELNGIKFQPEAIEEKTGGFLKPSETYPAMRLGVGGNGGVLETRGGQRVPLQTPTTL
jgi:hypothetical protein